jgi:hypothetical protein
MTKSWQDKSKTKKQGQGRASARLFTLDIDFLFCYPCLSLLGG